MPDLSRPREVRLAEYVREYVRSRSTQIRRISSYEREGAVLWFKDVPTCEGVLAITQQGDLESDSEASIATWLQIEQQDVAPAPQPSRELEPWLEKEDLEAERTSVPRLKARALIEQSDATGEVHHEELALEDARGIKGLYSAFTAEWRAWAEAESVRLQARDLYEKLYQIHTQMKREGEQVELRIGVGFIDWPKSNSRGAQVERHAVTFSANLTFDARRGILTVEAPEDGVKIALEQDMFEVSDQPSTPLAKEVEGDLEALLGEDALWNRERMDGVLKAWGRILHPKGRWEPGLEPVKGEGDTPTLSFAPALILRRRGSASMVRIYDQIAARLTEAAESGDGAPAAWTALVETTEDRVERHEVPARDGSGTVFESSDGWPDRGDEIFFPLPANREQMEVVTGVRERRGVLVQGPPGTGKSHTIANLMCHLLASGQRVLVTAENPRALGVLLDKIPEDLRALCISVLGQGGASFRDLNATIQKIGARQNSWSKAKSETRISTIRGELTRARRKLQQVREDVRDLILGEAVSHQPAAGYTGKPMDLVTRVETRRAQNDWFNLPEGADSTPPISAADLVDWFELTSRIEEFRAAKADHVVPDVSDVPSALLVEELFDQERRSRQEFELRGRDTSDVEIGRIARQLGDRLDECELRVRAVCDGWEELLATPWVRRAALGLVTGTEATAWQTRIDRLGRIVEVLAPLEAKLGEKEIRLPESRGREELTADATIVLEHLQGGGKWKKLFGVPKAVQGREYFLTEATVDGSPADEAFEFELILFELKRRKLVEEAREFLPSDVTSGMATDGAGSSAPIRVALQQLTAVVEQVEADRGLRRQLERDLSTSIEADWLVENGARWVARWADAKALRGKQQAEEAIEEVVAPLARLAGSRDPHPAVASLSVAIGARDLDAYRQARHLLEDAERLRAQFVRMEELDTRFRTGAPALYKQVQDELGEADWSQRLAGFEDAWAWAFTERWLRKFGRSDALDSLRAEQRSLVKTEARLLEQLAAEYAWSQFFQRLTAKEATALESWRQSVAKMGKGTGRSARMERLRRDARTHMAACRDAIPVWIMPRYLVAEMIEPAAERFDTVIVDEASQMGINGLFVYYLGKRTIIVGDDQQISPSDVGVNEETLARLHQEHIPDINVRQVFDKGSSVYDHAKLRFRYHVTLREHFRCMPEIIQFSNDLCYAANGTPLDPLRGFGGDRLEPLKANYVPGGRRQGAGSRAHNDVEAEALVSRLIRCLDDPAYDDKTFGVLSLQAPYQAKLVESLLLSRLDPTTYEERRILCGDSATFQGDERDVIFLSMVAAEGETRISALTAQAYMQRYNVAVSRARDQVWLFHSLQAADLKPECLRRRLIEFVRTPARAQVDPADMQFDSPFEREVFDRIQERGFRVVTQVPVGDGQTYSYRIDLVVEGLSGSKLAVECDGSAYHGPERFEADMARQRDLERVGWEFVRIPGSAFYRDRDAALEPLWEELERQGIWPRGTDADLSDGESHEDSGSVKTALDSTSSSARDSAVVAADASKQAIPHASEFESPDGDVEGANADPEPESEAEDRAAAELPARSGWSTAEAEPAGAWRYHVVDLGFDWEPSAEPESTPDPREVRLTTVAKRIVDLVRALGPMPADSILRHYRERSPVQRRGRIVEERLQRALAKTLRDGRVLCEEEPGTAEWGGVLRLPETPHVVIRMSGDRKFEDIPPSEWAARIRKKLARRAGQLTDEVADTIQRQVLQEAGFSVRATRLSAMEGAFRLAMDVRLPGDGATT